MWIQYKNQIISLLLLWGYNTSGMTQERQVSDYTRELNIKISSSDERKIDKGIKILVEADNQLNQAEDLFTGLTELEQKEKISENYEKSLKYYESQARKHLLMAAQRRDQVLWTDRYEYAKIKIREANELEREAINDQTRALQIYSDYPVEYNYEWENDVTLEEIYEIYKNPAVNEPPEDIYATVDPKAKIDPAMMEEIIFKVQIAAHTVPLTEEYLRTIYRGGMSIDMIYEDEWYKYSIGRYLNFEEATRTLEDCKVRKAFIVAYQGGKKLTIQEAINLLDKMQ